MPVERYLFIRFWGQKLKWVSQKLLRRKIVKKDHITNLIVTNLRQLETQQEFSIRPIIAQVRPIQVEEVKIRAHFFEFAKLM